MNCGDQVISASVKCLSIRGRFTKEQDTHGQEVANLNLNPPHCQTCCAVQQRREAPHPVPLHQRVGQPGCYHLWLIVCSDLHSFALPSLLLRWCLFGQPSLQNTQHNTAQLEVHIDVLIRLSSLLLRLRLFARPSLQIACVNTSISKVHIIVGKFCLRWQGLIRMC